VPAFSVTEIRNFIHIKPNSIYRKNFIELLKLFNPEICGVGMKPINESCIAWPYFSLSWLISVSTRHVNLLTQSSLIGGRSHILCNSSINNGNKVFSFSMQRLNVVLSSNSWISRIIECEVPIQVHIINISPHSIQRNVILIIAISDIFPLIQIMITIPALVPSKRPIRHKNRLSNNLMKLF